MRVTLAQVDRHFRHYKENWKYIAAAISKSGNVFDDIRCVVTISESEKSCLNVRIIYSFYLKLNMANLIRILICVCL
jgi:hypothetical protein